VKAGKRKERKREKENGIMRAKEIER